MAGPHHCLRAPRPGPVGQAARLSETAIAFASLCLCGVETVIAFAGEKRAFLACFSVAVATSVSTVAVQGRAVVMAVSYWPVSAVAVVLVVSMSPWCRASRAKKFALRAQNTPNSAFLRSLGEFLRKCRCRGGVGRVSSHQPVLCQGLVDDAAHFRLAVLGVVQH